MGLKIYDPDPEKSLTKAKLSKLKQEQAGVISKEVETGNVTNYFEKLPVDESVFNCDFSLLPNFVPNDTLEHQKNCGKHVKKSDDANVEFASTKGLRMLPFVHDSSLERRIRSRSHISQSALLGLLSKVC